MSGKILTTMYRAMRTNDESPDEYCVLRWTSELYTLQEDKEKEGYTQTITAYTGMIVCYAVLLNPVPNSKYWYTPTKIGVDDTTVRLKQVLPPNITMMKIDKINTLPKICKKREATKFGAINMSNEDIYELLEYIYRRDKLDTYFDMEYDEEDINCN